MATVATANVDPGAPAKPLRVIVRYPRAVHLDAAIKRLLATPAATVLGASSGAPLTVAAVVPDGGDVSSGSSTTGGGGGSGEGSSGSGVGGGGGAPLSSVQGVRVVKRLRGGGVRGVLLELPASTPRGGAFAALKSAPEVLDVEEEGIVTVQIAKGALLA